MQRKFDLLFCFYVTRRDCKRDASALLTDFTQQNTDPVVSESGARRTDNLPGAKHPLLFNADVQRALVLPNQMNQNKGVNAPEVTLWLMRTSPYMILGPSQTIDIGLCRTQLEGFFLIEILRDDLSSSVISQNLQLKLEIIQLLLEN
ncbi:hypothetical protein D9C73_008239 [Collichthys lucidus]|uniref:Uncharacterized protein n=1 Tax=Collichthys lucidus TaxID=240159 RepID=A0A4U5UIU4_COLLU|nr:hypothetical protein D9C73_008239 [Collichthys lucidus]